MFSTGNVQATCRSLSWHLTWWQSVETDSTLLQTSSFLELVWANSYFENLWPWLTMETTAEKWNLSSVTPSGASITCHNTVVDRWSKPQSLIALTPVLVLVAVCLLKVHSPVLLIILVILLLPLNSNRLLCNKQETLAIEKWRPWR